MHLREALNQIAEIRLRLAESEVFRGYRSLPVALSGLFAFAGGIVQSAILPDPMANASGYVAIWGTVALLSIAAAGTTMFLRDCFAGCSHTRAITWLALRQLVPCLIAGGGITLVMLRHANDACWMLPGLWAVLFSQGIFASARLLPRPIFVVGVYYLVAGLFTLMFANGVNSLSPLSMALTFGIGQFLTAGVLYWTLERKHAEIQ
jgi:hypothetical protein